MPSDKSTTRKEQTNKPAAEVPSKQQQQQQSHTRPTSQLAEEWLKKLDDLEAQSKGSQGDTTKLLDPAQVKSRQLSPQVHEGMDHEDILDALERGEVYKLLYYGGKD